MMTFCVTRWGGGGLVAARSAAAASRSRASASRMAASAWRRSAVAFSRSANSAAAFAQFGLKLRLGAENLALAIFFSEAALQDGGIVTKRSDDFGMKVIQVVVAGAFGGSESELGEAEKFLEAGIAGDDLVVH